MISERPALIAAILADPEEDTPRLACADWFEEQGDDASVARAEFIRVQIERANLPPADPRQQELQARELRLLKRHGTDWCSSHFSFKKCRFRRGFIEYVHLHMRHFLFHRRQMLALEPVRDISLTGWMRATDDLVQRVAACEEWRHVETLRIHHQGPHKSPRSPLAHLIECPHLTRLRSLHMPMLSITSDARRRIERAPVLRRLEELTLPGLDFFPDQPGEWLADGPPAEPWKKLRTLRLRGYSVSPQLLARLTAMPFWNRLTELDVNLGWSQPEQIEALRDRLPDSLRVLRLRGDEHNFEGGAAVDSVCHRIADLPLKGLHIRAIPLGTTALDRLLGEGSRCALQELALSQCELPAETARVIANSSSVRDVWSLDLSSNGEPLATALEVLLGSEEMRSVSRLNLSGTPLGEAGATALAAAAWDGLRFLAIDGTGIREDHLAALFTSAAFQNLVSLRFGGDYRNPTPITPALARRLVELPHLASLRMEMVALGDEARSTLLSSESLAWPAVDRADRENWGDFDPNVLAPLDEELSHADQA